MNLFWIIWTQPNGKSIIKRIKIATINNYSSKDIRQMIFKEFNLDFDVNIRLRNYNGYIVPITKDLDVNTKMDPYSLQVYREAKQNSNRIVTNRPEVTFPFSFILKNNYLLKIHINTIRIDELQWLVKRL